MKNPARSKPATSRPRNAARPGPARHSKGSRLIRPLLEQFEDRILLSNDLYVVPGTAGASALIRFDWTFRDSSFQNEVGVFKVDDAQGRVNGFLPGAAGYAATALRQGEIVFARGQGAGARKDIAFHGGDRLGFYLVQNGTTAAALAGQKTAFFSFAAANSDRCDHVEATTIASSTLRLAWEDLLGLGDRDFNDAVITVSMAPTVKPNLTAIQVQGPAGQAVPTKFTLTGKDSSYHNELGLFPVDGPEGRIGALRPGDAGYAKAALAGADRKILFTGNRSAGATTTVNLAGQSYFALYLVQNSSTASFLQKNPSNSLSKEPVAFLLFRSANPDGFEHVQWQSVNTFAFEDLTGGGDRDFNDLVAKFEFGSAPNPDTTPPVVTAALAQDTGNGSDRITSDPGVQGAVTDDRGVIALFEAAIDGRPFQDARPLLNANGAYQFDAARMALINGGPLSQAAHTLHLRARDAAGNQGLADFTFTLDTAPPIITGSRTPAANAEGWNSSDVVVHFTATDNLSGVASVTGPVTLSAEGAGQSVTGTATDVAGNSASAVVSGINIDRTRPTTAATLSGPAGNAGWYRGAVTVGLAGADALAGVRNVLYALDGGPTQIYSAPVIVSGDGTHELSYWSVDRADNEEAHHSQAVRIDTTPPVVSSFTLEADSDAPPLGDNHTDHDIVDLVGRTEPTVSVTWLEGNRTTAADVDGYFRFSQVPLALGDNAFTLRAVDAAGNESTPLFTITRMNPCGFEEGLQGWTVSVSGGAAAGAGSVTEVDGRAVLREGNSFVVTLARTFDVPTSGRLTFEFSQLAFDETAPASINDAFEVALVDAAGRPLVGTIGVGRDAFFNLVEGSPAALGAQATIDGTEVTVDLSAIPAGTVATLLIRLVNNDGDTATSVRIDCVDFPEGSNPRPAILAPQGDNGSRAARLASPAAAAVDPSGLSDVSASIQVDYARTSFDEGSHTLFADVTLSNAGQYGVDGPLLVGITHISDPSVRVLGADGVTADGIPYYDFTALLSGGILRPGDTSGARSFVFFDPQRSQFTYDVVILGGLNRVPEVTSEPDVEAIVGKPYAYDVQAADADGDALTYSLMVAPAGMSIDSASGRITWAPAAADLGSASVIVRVEDGRGGVAEQTYALAVIQPPPNRPPVFTSVPVVSASVNTVYTYRATAVDADGDALTFSLGEPAVRDIAIVNASFEAQVLDDGRYLFAIPPGWTSQGAGAVGPYNPPDFIFPGGIPDGQNVSFSDGATLSQILTERLEAGRRYHLQVQVGDALTIPTSAFSVELLAGGVVLASASSPMPADGGFAMIDLIYNSSTGHPGLGQNLEIRLKSAGVEVYFDNVRLTVTEPGPFPVGMQVDAATGLLNWTPSAAQGGQHLVVIRAEDGHGAVATQSFVIEVGPDPGNHSPRIVSTPVTATGIPTLYVTGYLASDVKEYTLNGVYARTVVQSGSGGLVKPESLQIGPDGVLYVCDATSVKKYDPITGEYLGNLATGFRAGDIVFDDVGNAYVSTYLQGTVGKYSPDGVLLRTYDMGSGTWGLHLASQEKLMVVLTVDGPLRNTLAELDLATGVFRTHTTGLSEPFGIAVGSDGRYYFANFTFAHIYGGFDPDTIYVVGPEGGVAQRWNVSKGDLNGTTDLVFADDDLFVTSYYNSRVVRFDGATEIFVGSFDAPGGANFIGLAGAPYSYDVDAVDPDLEALTYSLVAAPERMTIDPATGRISWFPTESDLGQHTISVRASDGRGGFDTQSFAIEVTTEAGIDLTVADVNQSGLTFDGQALTVSGPITAKVTNHGPSSLDRPFRVTFFEDRNGNETFEPAADNVLGFTEVTAPLAAGQTVTVVAQLTGHAWFTNNRIWAVVDSENAITETDETNNLAVRFSEFIPPVGQLDPVVKWNKRNFTVRPDSYQVMMSPVVIDVNADGIPDIIFSTWSGNYANGLLRAISGDDGHELWTVTDPQYAVHAGSGLAAGDIDGDGKPEIIAGGAGIGDRSSSILAFENDGTFKWRRDGVNVDLGAASLADLDQNATPEIIVGRTALNNDGTVRWVGTAGSASHLGFAPLSVAADLDLDGVPEVVAGNSAYHSDGTLYWQNASVRDGAVALGNFDADLYPEIVVTGAGYLYLLEHNGAIKWGPILLPSDRFEGINSGTPAVGDLDGDGSPEIGLESSSRYLVYNADGTLKWSQTIQEISGARTGSSFFDFDGDGKFEVVHGDELFLRIFRGSDGTVLYELPKSSGTLLESPLVVDVDADGHAEIVAVANDYAFGPQRGIFVIGDRNDTWVPTRQIWNQHAYHVTNVNDDGTIPAHEENSWQVHNTYRANLQPDPLTRFAAPELTASYVRVGQAGAQTTYTARLGNGGSAFVAAGVKVAFYDGDPRAGGVLLGTASSTQRLDPGAYQDLTLTVAGPATDLWVRADDSGTGLGQVSESDETNNLYHPDLSIPPFQPGVIRGSVFDDLNGNGAWDRGFLLVASHGSNSIKAYDGTTGQFRVDFVPPGSGGLVAPHGLTYGPDGNLYVVGHQRAILRYDGATGQFLDAFAALTVSNNDINDIALFGPDGNVYVSGYLGNGTANGKVARYDGTTGANLGVVLRDGDGGLFLPIWLSFGPDGNLYVSSHFTNSVLRYNPESGAFIDVFASGNGLSLPTGLAFGPDGDLFVVSQGERTVKRFDGLTGQFLGNFTSGISPGPTGAILFGPDGNLYASAGDNNRVLRYDGITGQFIDVFVASASGGLSAPVGIVFSPDAEFGDSSSWTVYLDQNGNGLRDAGERFTITDVLGNYAFDNLPAGT